MTTLTTEVDNKAMEIAERWRIQGEWDDALTLLYGIIPVAKRIGKGTQTAVWLQIGQILADEALFGGKENSNKREEALAKAEKLAEQSGKKALLGDVYDARGMSLHVSYLESDRSQEFEEEIDFFERGLDLRKEHGSLSQMAESTFHIGLVYDVVRQEYDKASVYHQEAYELAKEAGDKMIMSYAIRHIGYTRLVKEDIAGARKDLTESLELRRSLNFIPGTAFALAHLRMLKI